MARFSPLPLPPPSLLWLYCLSLPTYPLTKNRQDRDVHTNLLQISHAAQGLDVLMPLLMLILLLMRMVIAMVIPTDTRTDTNF